MGPLTDAQLVSHRQSWAAGFHRGQRVSLDRDEALAIIDELLELRKSAAQIKAENQR